MRMLKFFDLYTEVLGWEVIPLLSKSKLPFVKGWNVGSYDKQVMRQCVEKHPKCNIGLRLGEIIDVEGDTPQANELLIELTSGCRHPMYKSKKSIHHLFQTPDQSLTRIAIGGIEFRGKFHQSVLPPSVVGREYEWIDCKFPIPLMPEGLLDLYNKYVKVKNSKYVKPWCYLCCSKSRPINKERFRLEVIAFEKIHQKWRCHNCRKSDLRKICKKMKAT